MLQILYSAFIGIMVSLFVGFGIAAFYPAPNQQEFNDKSYERYIEASKEYNRNVAVAAVVISVLILLLSLVIVQNIPAISDGLLLGGILTLLYGTAQSIGTGDERIMFAFVTVGLVVAVAIGYLKFVRKPQ